MAARQRSRLCFALLCSTKAHDALPTARRTHRRPPPQLRRKCGCARLGGSCCGARRRELAPQRRRLSGCRLELLHAPLQLIQRSHRVGPSWRRRQSHRWRACRTIGRPELRLQRRLLRGHERRRARARRSRLHQWRRCSSGHASISSTTTTAARSREHGKQAAQRRTDRLRACSSGCHQRPRRNKRCRRRRCCHQRRCRRCCCRSRSRRRRNRRRRHERRMHGCRRRRWHQRRCCCSRPGARRHCRHC